MVHLDVLEQLVVMVPLAAMAVLVQQENGVLLVLLDSLVEMEPPEEQELLEREVPLVLVETLAQLVTQDSLVPLVEMEEMEPKVEPVPLEREVSMNHFPLL